MKKKQQKSDEAPAGYVVGQVAGSLFQKDAAASGSLSALFSVTPPAAPVVFQPAPKAAPQSAEVKTQRETPEVKGHSAQKNKKKPPKQKSAAEQKLDSRESSLQNADEEDQAKTSPKKKKKRKAPAEEEEEAAAAEERRPMKRPRTKADAEAEADKRKRTVFVGNLPVSCTRKTLRSLFRDKGAIESIRFRSVVREDPSMSRKLATIQRKVHPNKQSINAYVVFRDEDGVAKALQRNGMEIEQNFHIRVDRVTENPTHDHKRSVFVGNLSFEIRELVFRQHFEECGAVEAVRLVRDPNSGLGKGFGYVLFESADSVQLALKLNGSSLEGRSIRVKRSVKKEKVKSQSHPSRGNPAKGPTRGPTRGPGGPEGQAGERRDAGKERKGFQERKGFKERRGFTGRPAKSTSSPSSFKGVMVDPSKKAKKKGLKKKLKPKKTVHI
ncbi:RNA-binding protein 34 [Myripristis murdjan]|uniref:RNA binding motif protein 34 n=1 Tax=Myripristis murdjan TaxID=586833 RepID=A0A667XJB6_9TELE|nr:RNA-binding protein 34 [Myripristis murdjan]